MTTTAVLVDDQTVVREGVRLLLETRGRINVVGTASSGRDALDMVHATSPNVMVTEIALPDGNGIETTRIVREQYPLTHVLILTRDTSTAKVVQALHAGACGYVTKAAGYSELIAAVRRVAAGGRYLSPEVVRALPDTYAGERLNPLVLLSAREREVLQLTVEGVSSPTIAQRLGLGINTVDACRRRVKSKLGIDTTADLVKFAIRHQLTAVD